MLVCGQVTGFPMVQPVAGSQVSVPLHASPSPQGIGVPPTHIPLVGSHIGGASHMLVCGQVSGVPIEQTPPEQVSVPVQASKSSHSASVVHPSAPCFWPNPLAGSSARPSAALGADSVAHPASRSPASTNLLILIVAPSIGAG